MVIEGIKAPKKILNKEKGYIKNHRRLWDWAIREKKHKSEWPEWENNGGKLFAVGDCFACDYAEDLEMFYDDKGVFVRICDVCTPNLIAGKKFKGRKFYDPSSCLAGLFDAYEEAYTVGNEKEASKLAEDIRDLWVVEGE